MKKALNRSTWVKLSYLLLKVKKSYWYINRNTNMNNKTTSITA